jgi:hypothetical protein
MTRDAHGLEPFRAEWRLLPIKMDFFFQGFNYRPA